MSVVAVTMLTIKNRASIGSDRIPLKLNRGRPPTGEFMHLITTTVICKGVKYSVRAIEDKHGYREEVSCSHCKVWFNEDHLYWIDPVTNEMDFDGVPVCRKCHNDWNNAETTTYRKAA